MSDQPLPSFAELRTRFAEPGAADLAPPGAEAAISLRHAIATGDDPVRCLAYLRGFGIAVDCLDDLARGIASLPDEEELSAHPCREGVAVLVASDGAWTLFVP